MKRSMNTADKPVTRVNLKEEDAKHIFPITFRDRDQFYRIVNWLNINVGKGSDKWTCAGSILSKLNDGKLVDTKIYIFIDNFDPMSILYINLL